MIQLEKSVKRVTRGALDHHYGADSGRRLVASFEPGDLVTVRPHGTRRPETVSLFDLYAFAIRCRVNRARLEKAREKKSEISDARERARLRRSIRRGLLQRS